MNGLDAHARPPEHIREFYKRFHKKSTNGESVSQVLNINRALEEGKARVHSRYDVDRLNHVFEQFNPGNKHLDIGWSNEGKVAFEHVDAPGLLIVPNLLPPSVQVAILDRSLHRDLSNPQHLTNVHKFYNVPYAPALGEESGKYGSFFSLEPSDDPTFHPLDESVHKPLSVNSFLHRKLRWMTTGGQYDWTEKIYPKESPPNFPPDIGTLLHGLFPGMRPEAAIVNVYTPGDTLSMHRDVAEYCGQGLISVSIGCDAVFIIGLDEQVANYGDLPPQPAPLAIRLQSGDAVYMAGPSRFAWHGVPQILANTCPPFLQDWPAIGAYAANYGHRKGWMTSKRINLNVRQMFDR